VETNNGLLKRYRADDTYVWHDSVKQALTKIFSALIALIAGERWARTLQP